MCTLLLRFGIILEKLHGRHERSGNAVQCNVGIKVVDRSNDLLCIIMLFLIPMTSMSTNTPCLEAT